ncbi:MAG: antitoxin, partial [Acidimicrobiales bacterium]
MNLGKLAKTVKGVVDKQGDKIASGVDKATDFVDKKTKGKYTDKLQKVDSLADKLDKTKGKDAGGDAGGDTTPPAPPPPPPP